MASNQEIQEALAQYLEAKNRATEKFGKDPNFSRLGLDKNQLLEGEAAMALRGGFFKPAQLAQLKRETQRLSGSLTDPNALGAGAPSKGSGIGRVFSDLGGNIASGAQNVYDEGARPVAGAAAGAAGGFLTGGPVGAFAGGAMGLRNGLVNDSPVNLGGLASSAGQGAAAGGALRGLSALASATNTAPSALGAVAKPAVMPQTPGSNLLPEGPSPSAGGRSPFGISFRSPVSVTGAPSLGGFGLPAGLSLSALPSLGKVFGGLGKDKPEAPASPQGPTAPTGGPFQGGSPGLGLPDYLQIGAGAGLLGAGLLGDEDRQTFAQPTDLDPSEQAQIDALTKNSQSAYNQAMLDLQARAGQQEGQYAGQLAAQGEPLLLEELRKAREAAGGRGIGSSGIEGSGALGEAFARQAGLRNAGYQQQAAGVFAPLRAEALRLGTQGTLSPLEYQRGGAERLFGLRDISSERQYAADQARLQRKNERQRAMIGAGSNLLSGGLSKGRGGVFSQIGAGYGV